MRVEPISIGGYMHSLKRGGRGENIFIDTDDYYRCARSLFYMNDHFLDENWDRATYMLSQKKIYSSQTAVNPTDRLFFRPPEWPARKPTVKILAYCLMPNHLHLLLKEITEGGISKFMKKFGQSMTNHSNEKYDTKGSIFQSSYKGKTINEDSYLRLVAVYIMVKNPFELYPKGFAAALKNFEDAWKWAMSYPFSSLPDYAGGRKSPIVEKDILGKLFSSSKEFKKFAKEYILLKAEKMAAVALE